MPLDTDIAHEAQDLLPETWNALSESNAFGDAALQRAHDRVLRRTLGSIPNEAAIASLHYRVVEYIGKRLALNLIDPAIDFWSKQVMQHTAGERESKMYQQRGKELENLRKLWTAELAALWPGVQPLIPGQPGRAADAPRVVQAGETVEHTTANPGDLEPMFGPLEEIL